MRLSDLAARCRGQQSRLLAEADGCIPLRCANPSCGGEEVSLRQALEGRPPPMLALQLAWDPELFHAPVEHERGAIAATLALFGEVRAHHP